MIADDVTIWVFTLLVVGLMLSNALTYIAWMRKLDRNMELIDELRKLRQGSARK